MGLEDQLQKKKRIIRRYPSAEALEQVEKGNKFIIVKDDFDLNYVPQGYTLIDMKHKGSSFKTLIPQPLLFFIANPGEGDTNQALGEIADFYGEAEDFEDDMIKNGETNVQEANWATLARGSYETYLINKLVKHRRGEKDEEGESVPEFDKKVLQGLDLNDSYVSQRVKAIAALALGKTADQVNARDVRDILKHVTINYKQKEKVEKQKIYQVKCWAGSHYEMKDEYRIVTKNEWVKKSDNYSSFNSEIGDLETDIAKYRVTRREGKSRNIGRHDQALIRQYINLAYIAPENPRAQLDIKPPEKYTEKEK